jgi:tRNA(adenine34) deaminase
MKNDETFMAFALREAQKAAPKGEVPIGAVVVDAEGKILARAHNLRESKGDPTAHAEVLALRKAAARLRRGRDSQLTTHDSRPMPHAFALSTQHSTLRTPHSALRTPRSSSWRLTGCTIYVTLEPCPMCAGALVNARVSRLVFGCSDPKAGACGSLYNVPQDKRLNHRMEVTSGVLANECAAMLRAFFGDQRKRRAR